MNICDLLQSDGRVVRKVSTTNGGEYCGPCPDCGGDDRFRVWPEQGSAGRYWCRGCGRSGDAIQYLRDFRKMGFREACEYIGHYLPLSSFPLHGRKALPKREPREGKAPSELWQGKARNLIKDATYHLWAPHGQRWLGWLKDQRGLSEATIKAHSLGLMPKDRYEEREAWGLEQVLKDNGQPKKLWLPEGLVIPYFNENQILRLRFRRPKSAKSGPRYYLLPGSDNRAMVLNPGRDIFVVVESELDGFLIAQEAGDMVVVVALGSAQVRPDKELVEKLGRSQLILVALDADSAGGKEAWDWWDNEFSQAHRWPPVDAKDPGEMLAIGVDLRAWVEVGIEEALEQTTQGNEVCRQYLPVPGSVENLEELQEVLELAFAGKLTKAMKLPVSPRFQAVLKTDFVWLCPNRMDAEKMPGLAFAAHELSTIVPMVHENPELAAKLIMAKDVLGGAIISDDDKKERG